MNKQQEGNIDYEDRFEGKPSPEERMRLVRASFERVVAEGVLSAIILVERPGDKLAIGVLGSEADLLALFNTAGDQLIDMLRKAKANRNLNG
jgi:hypothetical protein